MCDMLHIYCSSSKPKVPSTTHGQLIPCQGNYKQKCSLQRHVTVLNCKTYALLFNAFQLGRKNERSAAAVQDVSSRPEMICLISCSSCYFVVL